MIREKLHQLGWRISPLTMAWLGAFRDYHFRDLTDMWGGRGPFNGQARRTEMMRALLDAFRPQLVVETGTYFGSTSEWLAKESGVTVHTVEVNARYFFYSAWRLRSIRNLKRHRADSRDFLRRLEADPRIPSQSVLFYLDAHDFGNWPLNEELILIQQHWTDSIVVIDDFLIDDDSGYGFLAGEDWQFSLESVPAGYAAFFPTAPSSDETGAKRGAVVLGLGQTVKLLAAIPSLRPAASRQAAGA